MIWLCFCHQVSSINRVLRNLASTTQKNELNPYMMDKFGLLNGQAWPRPNPWYANPAGLPGMGYNQYPQPPPPPISQAPTEKKGMWKFIIYWIVGVCRRILNFGQIFNLILFLFEISQRAFINVYFLWFQITIVVFFCS